MGQHRIQVFGSIGLADGRAKLFDYLARKPEPNDIVEHLAPPQHVSGCNRHLARIGQEVDGLLRVARVKSDPSSRAADVYFVSRFGCDRFLLGSFEQLLRLACVSEDRPGRGLDGNLQ